MTLTRRLFARTALAGMAAVPAGAASITALSGPVSAQTAGTITPLARIRIGKFTVTFVTDGYADAPFGWFTGQDQAALEAAAEAAFAHRGGGMRLAFTQYLIDDGERLVLVDTGPAGRIGETTGRLPAALETIGVAPADIDAVIVTHTHFDHISGLVAGGRKVFENAELYVDRRDIAYFTDRARRAASPDFLLSSFDTTEELIRLYPGLQRIEGAHTLTSGLETVDLSGHTPGQIGVRISDAGESLMLVSDMLFHPVVHPVSAVSGFVFEMDPEAALEMRIRFFAEAEAEGTLIAATHMPFPGLGRIVNDRYERRWLPAEWAYAG